MQAFPRGGDVKKDKGLKRPLTQDNIFGNKRAKLIDEVKKKKKSDNKSKVTPQVSQTIGLGNLSNSLSKISKIESLNASKFTPGTLVLGVVLSVSENQATISLLGGYIGLLDIEEYSDVFHKMASQNETLPNLSSFLKPYQILRCYIIGSQNPEKQHKSKLLLSSRSSLVNRGLALKHLFSGLRLSCCIVSKEDHGYILSGGINAVNFFLGFKDTKGGKQYNIGQQIECIVKEVNEEARTVTLSNDNKVREIPIQSTKFPFNSLSAGMLFEVLIDKKIDNGLIVNYLSLFKGVIDLNSMSTFYSPIDWKNLQLETQILKARIIFIDHSNKTVRLSLKKEILDYSFNNLKLPQLGETLQDLTIISSNKKQGVILSAPNPENLPFAILIPKKTLAALSDEPSSEVIAEDSIPTIYQTSQPVKMVRVTGYHLIEGLISSTNISDHLTNNVMHFSEIKVGEIYKVEISSIKDFGLLVSINNKINAICPLLHTGDFVVDTKLNKKFKIGQKLNMRVWEVQSDKGSIIMTNKKSLVDYNGIFIMNYEECKSGLKVKGVVSKVSNDGIEVRFFNKIKGNLPAKILAQQGVLNPIEDYRVGQVVDVIIIKKVEYPGKKKDIYSDLILALDLNLTVDAINTLSDSLQIQNFSTDANQSKLVTGTIYKIEEECFLVRLENGKTAKLAFSHLCDFAETSLSLKKSYKVGDRIENALVLFETNNYVSISIKPLLLTSIASSNTDDSSHIVVPSLVSDLSPGLVVAGFITKVESFGVFVGFLNNLSALAPRPSLADRFISSPIGIYKVGDSIRCVVQRVDLTKNRAIISFKPSMVPPSTGENQYLLMMLKEKYLQYSLAESQTQLNWEKYPINKVINATISSKEDFGWLLLADNNSTFILDKSILNKSKSYKIGDKVEVLVYDMDFSYPSLEGFILESSFQQKKKVSKKSKPLQINTEYSVQVISVKDSYLVVLDSNSQQSGFVSLGDYHNPIPDLSDFQEGKNLSVIVERNEMGDKPNFPHQFINIFKLKCESKKLQPNKSSNIEVSLKDSSSLNIESSEISEIVHSKTSIILKIGSIYNWVIDEISPERLKLHSKELSSLVSEAIVDLSGAYDDFTNKDNLVELLKKMKPKADKSFSNLHPFSQFKIGHSLSCQVINLKKSTDDSSKFVVYLRIIRNPNNPIFHKMLQYYGYNEIKSPSICVGVVSKINSLSCTIALSPYIHTELQFIDVSKDEEIINLFKSRCFVGLRIIVAVHKIIKNSEKVIAVHISRALIEDFINTDVEVQDITNLENNFTGIFSDNSKFIEEGKIIFGAIDIYNSKKVKSPPALMVQLPAHIQGRLDLTEIADKYEYDFSEFFSSLSREEQFSKIEQLVLPNGIKHGDIIKCIVLSSEGKHVEVSTRRSRLTNIKVKNAIKQDTIPNEGQIVSGYIISISPKGCFLRLSNNITGRVMLKDLADEFVENPEIEYRAGRLVQGRVIKVDHLKGFVQVSLKPSVVIGSIRAQEEIKSIHGGDVLKGVVQRVNEIGVFIAIENTSLVGLARKVTAQQNSLKALQEEYQVGDFVKAKVLRVSRSSMKIALGLKDIYFKDDADQYVQESDDEEEEQKIPLETNINMEEVGSDQSSQYVNDDDSINMDEIEDIEEENIGSVAKRQFSQINALDIKKSKKIKTTVAGIDEDDIEEINWDNKPSSTHLHRTPKSSSDSEDSDDDSGDEKHGKSKLRNKQKEAQKRKEELDLRSREKALAEGKLIPEHSDDFERLLIAQPNSSFLWIQYIAFHLKNADLESARIIANRALRTIHFREEDEKYNVWIALLNMEYKYGNKETLDKAFNQAVSESKGKYIYLTLAQTYESNRDISGAQQIFEKALKKPQYRKSKKVWIAYLQFMLRNQKDKQAKEQLARALQSLGEHKHIEVIKQFALYEYEINKIDQGRVLFEELLHSYPKKTDLWHIYLDKEIKNQDLSYVRQLFERVITMSFSVKNMKTFFKKYLQFEVQQGTQEQQDHVKHLAREYVQNISA